MGKNASKHACPSRESSAVPAGECFLVNAHLTGTLEEEIWKNTKTGFNLANYNMNHSLSELSICLEEKQDNIPLKVELPPAKRENDTSKVLLLDQNETDGKEKGGTEHTAKGLNIEEVECGVQFGGLDSKQEWSFTLYDFDGHGKITKEDLSSLLKALYDAVGSSIKIPSNGTRTLKLRLTVGPDGSYSNEARAVCNKENFPKESKKDTPTKDSPRKKDKIRFKDSPNKLKSSSKVKEFSKLNNLTRTNVKCTNETRVGQNGVKPKIPLCPQISTQEHQQLADLVQANMERNQIRQLRRHHSDCKNNPQEHSHQKRHHHSHHNNLGNNNNDNDDQPKESQDRRNYYLDLAGIENNTSKFQPTVTALPTEQNNGSPSRRSRSQETKCDNVKREVEQNNRKVDNSTTNRPDHLRSRSFDPQENGQSPKGNPVLNSSSSPTKPQRERGFRPFSLPAHLPEMVSPHHHRRHRHRDKDHDLAMQQVAEWIEREHSWDVEGDRIVIQHHQHHHVHEHHHHHHYHHYYEA